MGQNDENKNVILIHSKQGSNDGKKTLDDMIKKLQEETAKESNKQKASE